MWNAIANTVEPRLTNTLLRQTPNFKEQFGPVPNIFSVKSCLKTPLWANSLALPVGRTTGCPPKVFASEVFPYLMKMWSCFHPSFSVPRARSSCTVHVWVVIYNSLSCCLFVAHEKQPFVTQFSPYWHCFMIKGRGSYHAFTITSTVALPVSVINNTATRT